MNNFKSRLNTENGIEITSVGQYLEKIKDSILSQMKNNITRLLIAVFMPMDSAKFNANGIVNNAILLYKAKGE